MTKYVDLSFFTYTESPWAFARRFPYILLNVGWLGDKLEDSGAKLDQATKELLLHGLKELARYPVNLYFGFHTCEICGWGPHREDSDPPQGNGEIWVQGRNNLVYVAPTMVIHYIEEHDYTPPEAFVDAVRNVSTMKRYRRFYDMYE